MQNYKKIITKIIIINIFITVLFVNIVQAKIDKNMIEKEIETYSKDIDTNNIKKEDVLKVYDDVTSKYTSKEIADIIEENKEEIKKQGISEEVINTSESFIRNTDTNEIRNIIKEDIDIEEIKNKIEKGYTPNQVLKEVIKEMPSEKKIHIATKVFFSNKIIKIILIVSLIWFIYSTILRWIIYSKAGEHGWAAIIPIYRQIVMYRICGLTPLFMVLWFVPLFGIIIMFIMSIVKRFCLASKFGRNGFFAFGLLILPPIFQTILACNPNIEYEG